MMIALTKKYLWHKYMGQHENTVHIDQTKKHDLYPKSTYKIPRVCKWSYWKLLILVTFPSVQYSRSFNLAAIDTERRAIRRPSVFHRSPSEHYSPSCYKPHQAYAVLAYCCSPQVTTQFSRLWFSARLNKFNSQNVYQSSYVLCFVLNGYPFPADLWSVQAP